MPNTKLDKLATQQPFCRLNSWLEEAFEDITRLAAQLCKSSIAFISLENGDRHCFKSPKSCISIPERNSETLAIAPLYKVTHLGCESYSHPTENLLNRNSGYCRAFNGPPLAQSHGSKVSLNPCDRCNSRDLNFPPQQPENAVQFYASYPLIAQAGGAIGTLSVIDYVPHQLDETQVQGLQALCRLAVSQLELYSQETNLFGDRSQFPPKSATNLTPHTLNAFTDAVFWMTSEGQLVSVNDIACQLLGYSREELLKLKAFDINPDISAAVWQKHWLSLKKRGYSCYESHQRTKNGEILPVEIAVNYLEIDSQEYICAFTRLKSDRASDTSIIQPATESEILRASEELHRITLNNITEAVFITDDSGRFTFICPNVEMFFGYSVAEIHALGNISQLLGENLFEWGQLKTTLEIQNIERLVRDKTGRQITVLVNVKCVCIQTGTLLYSCRDISDRRSAEEALYEEQERLRLLVESVKDYAIFMLDTVGQVVSWNAGAERITGYLSSEIIGQHFSCFYTAEEVQEEKPWKALRLAAVAGRLEEEGWCVRSDGSRFWADVAIAALRDKFGYLRGYSVVTRDFTDRKRIQDRLWHAAFYDALTGLPNRAFFTDGLWDAMEVAKQRPDYLFAVLFLDCDRFKLVNDSLGHSIGDQLLIAFSRRLQTCTRSGDIVARLGGDEFAILLEDIQCVNDVINVADRIHASLKLPFNLYGHEVFTTVSIGIAISRQPKADNYLPKVDSCDYDRPQDLLRDADTAMYRAKSRGRARHEVFNVAMHAGAIDRLQLETDLRRIISECGLNSSLIHNNSCFILHYQPIVSLKTGKLTGFEALVRWQHPTRGFISPVKFIPIAEDTGLIVPLGEWVLREACRQLRQWQEQFLNGRSLTMNVNLSSKQLAAPHLIEQVDKILLETDVEPRFLKLEITESLLMENTAAVAERLEQLRSRKIHLCIDDFGTGYSSLSYLQSLPTSTLKIDRCFVTRLGDKSENAEIIRAIVMLANNLGMSVVAEGVETEQQLAELKALQCGYGQGFLFAKPLDKQAAELLIARDRQW